MKRETTDFISVVSYNFKYFLHHTNLVTISISEATTGTDIATTTIFPATSILFAIALSPASLHISLPNSTKYDIPITFSIIFIYALSMTELDISELIRLITDFNSSNINVSIIIEEAITQSNAISGF